MKRAAVRFIWLSIVFVCAGTAWSQTTTPTAATPSKNESQLKAQQQAQVQEIQQAAQALQTKTQLDYNKLRDLSEFQDYLHDVAEMEQLRNKYAALTTKAQPIPSGTMTPPHAAKAH